MSAVVDDPVRPSVSEGPSIVDALVSPNETVAFLASALPSGEAEGVLAVLDPAALSPAGRVDLLTALDRQARWNAARQQRVLAAMSQAARRNVDADPDAERFLGDEVALALGVGRMTATDKLYVATDLTGRLADTLALIEAGDLSYWHGKTLSELLVGFDDNFAAKVQGLVLRRAVRKTPGEFRTAIRRVIKRLDQRDPPEKHHAAAADRRIISVPGEDGMGEVNAYMPADGCAIVMTTIDAWAVKRGPDDHRTPDQRRADALVDICLNALHDPRVPKAHGRRPNINVTVCHTTLLGLDDQPAELEGYGPISAAYARELAADPSGTWRRILTDDAGTLLDYGTTVYKPPQALADHVIARDQYCVHPGCGRTARRCHLDHRVPFPLGPTNADNLEPLCAHHHQLKHRPGWNLDRHPDGTYTWTTPTGRLHHYQPPHYPVPPPPENPDDDPPPF
jgi:Domain of unknown function (DUF222)